MPNVVNEKIIAVSPLPFKRAFDRSPIIFKKWTFQSGLGRRLKCCPLCIHQGDKDPRFKEGFAQTHGQTGYPSDICRSAVLPLAKLFNVGVYHSTAPCAMKLLRDFSWPPQCSGASW